MFSVNSVQQKFKLQLELTHAMADRLFNKIQQSPFIRRAIVVLVSVGRLIAYREHLVTKYQIARVF